MSNRPKLTLGWKGKSAPVPDIVFELEEVTKPMMVGASATLKLRIDPWSPLQPLDECLACWSDWMHGDSDRNLGISGTSGLVGDTDGHGVDPSEQQQARDTRIAIATDAMIESMSRIHIWAIYRLCSLSTPWRFPNADLVVVGEEARELLATKLKKNVCTSVLF